MEKEDLYIGLDVGTDSVGWAATNKNFELLRIKGKTAWGSRIFDAADSAEERRMQRSSRRRNERRKYRIKLLNEMFAPILNKFDPLFLLRLKNSTLWDDDKPEEIKGQMPLFKSRDEEKEYYKLYPTIWRLRKDLIENDENAFKDPRLIYLAIHHIIKYRGNFLSNGTFNTNDFDESLLDDINNYFVELKKRLDEDAESFVYLDKKNLGELIDILGKKYNAKETKKKIEGLVLIDEDIKPYSDLFITLLSGGSFDISKISDDYEKMPIKFDNTFDDKEDEYCAVLGDDFALVRYAKAIHDFIQLKELLRGKKFISESFDEIYESHKNQLRYLKDICCKLDDAHNLKGEESLYFKLFKDTDSANNYAAFVHKNTTAKRPMIHDFNAFVLKELNPYMEELSKDKDFNKLKILIDQDELLMTISVASTSLIPHQLHQTELEIILENASKYYSEINEEFNKKIIQLFLFRVPYFYGPLNSNSPYSNVERLTNETVTPWNIEKVIDRSKTREKFMNNLTNNCTYIIGAEDVLPLDSLTYQSFVILNRLNGLRINGSRIVQEVKEKLYRYILLRKKTTVNQVKTFLKKEYDLYKSDDVAISGVNENDSFVSDSYFIMSQVFKSPELDNDKYILAEKIIFYCALYPDNIDDALDVFVEKEGIDLSKEQRKIIKQKSYKGWGNLSNTLLTKIKHVDESGVVHSIMDVLKGTTLNFQEILFSELYSFKNLIEKENYNVLKNKSTESVVKEIIDSMPPKMRRSTTQAYRIINEIVDLYGKEPKYISIEVTRENDEKKKGKESLSRSKEIAKFISAIKKDSNEFFSAQGKHVEQDYKRLEEEDNLIKLKSKHIYLYFKQNGIDLYTGERIDFNELLTSQKYDIDHIVPQRLIKDDSLDNCVLVSRETNQNVKKGLYPIPEQIRCNPDIVLIWKLLKKNKLISDKKYNNLIRANELTDDELQTFVNAQINVINQSNIYLMRILSVKYPKTTLIFSKSQYPSFIRKKYSIPKLRDLNDNHHAVDAYLNIITGVTLHNEYTKDYFIRKNDSDFSYNPEKRLEYVINHRNLNNLIVDTCNRHDFLLTYRYQYSDKSFYDQTIYDNKKKSLISLHTKGPMANTNKYGGYNNLSVYYFLVAEIEGKKNKKILIDVPYLWEKLFSKSDLLMMYRKELKLKDDEILSIDFNHKIWPNSKIIYNNLCYLVVNSNKECVKLKPILPIYLKNEFAKYVHFLLKHIDDIKGNENDCINFVTNLKETHIETINKKANIAILNELIIKARAPKYNACPMITQLRDYSVEEFANQNLYNQAIILKDMMLLFTRKSESSKTFVKNNFRKSKQSLLLNSNFQIIYDSISGLLSYKKAI